MDAAVSELLGRYEQRARKEWEVIAGLSEAEVGERIEEFLIFVGPDTAKLMHMLVTAQKAKYLVEIGASYGYSTIWLADAARSTGGKLHSLELSAKKVEYCRAQLRSVELDAFVEFHVGDARESLAALPAGIEFVLLDLWKDLYIPCFDLFYPKLAPGGFIAADNMIYPPNTRASADEYRAHAHQRPDIESVLLPIGSGVELSRKRGAR
jgi:predicted O-methyltransferase YrrM